MGQKVRSNPAVYGLEKATVDAVKEVVTIKTRKDEQKVIAMRCLADGQAPVELWRSIRRNPPPFDAAELRRLQAMREAFEAQDVEPQRQETENIAAAAAARRTNAENILRLCDHAAADPTADQRALWSAINQLGTQPA
jgi:hypothetical protein